MGGGGGLELVPSSWVYRNPSLVSFPPQSMQHGTSRYRCAHVLSLNATPGNKISVEQATLGKKPER
jgi:hypothetical protein